MNYLLAIASFLLLAAGTYLFTYEYDSSYTASTEALDTALALENATSIENTLELVDAQHSEALKGFSSMEQLAKSKAAVHFMALTKSQNQLAGKAREDLASMADDLQFVENFNWETHNQLEWELLESRLEVLCPQLDSYHAQFSKIISILDEKVALADHPDVIKELFDGDTDMAAMIEKLRASQKNILESDKVGYQSFCVN